MTVLKIKMLALKSKLFSNPIEILSRALQPPQKRNIKTSIRTLLKIGALKGGDYSITEIGKMMSNLPLDLQFSRLIIMG